MEQQNQQAAARLDALTDGHRPAVPVQDGSVLTRDVLQTGILSSQVETLVGPGFDLFNPGSVSVTQMLVLIRPVKEPVIKSV